MDLRRATSADLDLLKGIDGVIESAGYLHLQHSGEGLAKSWRLEQRPAREKIIASNPIADDVFFVARQIIAGAEEGVVLVIEHHDTLAASAITQPRHDLHTLHVLDLRVDYDYRRQGLGSALIYELIQQTRNQELRALSVETLTNNLPASNLLAKCGFDLSGVDTRRRSNHDVVKESATLFWYAALD